MTSQRNAAFAAALFLAAVLVCAGWALEVFPRRNAEAFRGENEYLRATLTRDEKALVNAQSELRQTQGALLEAERALGQTQAALTDAQGALRRATERR
jgi:ABC-type transport system involved in cytochrome bd biosynthesis fused ATPase/permease subunit